METVQSTATRPIPVFNPLVAIRCLFIDQASHIVTAIRANHMRRNRVAALRALGTLNQLLVIVRTPRTRPGVAVFSFGNRHGIWYDISTVGNRGYRLWPHHRILNMQRNIVGIGGLVNRSRSLF